MKTNRAATAAPPETAARAASAMDLDSIRRAYRRYARMYDVVFGTVFAYGRRRTVARVNRSPAGSVLEIGVGTGLSLPRYRPDLEVVGIDVSRDMLDEARRRVARKGLPNVRGLLEMDAAHLAFPDDRFDAVVAMYVMTVVPDPVQVLREMRRVCRPGGIIYIVNHFAHEERGLRRTVEQGLARHASRLGWRPDFTMGDLLDGTDLRTEAVDEVPPFGLFRLVECRNGPAARPD